MAVGGIDVGRDAHFCCELDLDRRSLAFAERPLPTPAAVRWFQERSTTSICVDAPPLPNNGTLARARLGASTNSNRRAAEFQLGIGGCYGTPSTRPALSGSNGWMATGMTLWEQLAAATGWTIDLGTGAGQLLETHPTYGFKGLLGHLRKPNRGFGVFRLDPSWRLRPKRTPAGVAQRIELLRLALAELGVPVSDATENKWKAGIDWVDATLCAVMAAWRERGWATPIGAPAEGSIYLRLPKVPWRVTDEPSPFSTSSRRRVSSMPRTTPDQANAVILRLGAKAFGRLTQTDTLEILEATMERERCWLPVGNAKFSLETNLIAVGHRLCLAFGSELSVELTTAECRESSNPLPFPGKFNAWPQAVESRRWVEIVDLKPVPDPTAFWVRSNGDWRHGFSGGQAALLWGRVGSAPAD